MREPKLLCLSFLPRIFMRQRAVYFYAYRNREFSTQTQIIQLSSSTYTITVTEIDNHSV